MFPRPPRSPLFPYTTLFRSQLTQIAAQPHDGAERAQRLDAVVAARQPAARGDHVAGLEGERGERLALETAERVLAVLRSEEHTSELQSLRHLVCRLLLEKKK